MKNGIVIIDYGMGNLGSLQNMFRRIGAVVEVSSDLGRIADATKLVLPGVGAFDAAIARIDALGLRPLLRRRAEVDQIPFLGVCLGMQLLVESSEEGSLPGLGLIPGRAIRFDGGNGLKVPHMGWNDVRKATASPLTERLGDAARFYFVHSYRVHAADPAHAILHATYGTTFDAALQRANVFGVQFHPEKSHKFGMALLQSFVEL